MTVEEEYQDILQNMEFAIIQIYRQHADLIDAEVLTAIEALARLYSAQAQGKTLSARPIKGLSNQVMEAVQAMCQWRMGGSQPQDFIAAPEASPPSVETAVIAACLKRIQSSIKFWSKERGRQGYLNYVNQFIH